VSYGWQATRRLPTVARSAEVGAKPFLLFHLRVDPRSSRTDRSRTLAAAAAASVPVASTISSSPASVASGDLGTVGNNCRSSSSIAARCEASTTCV